MRTLTVAGLLAGALTLTACGGGEDPTLSSQAQSGAGDTAQTTELTDADVAFVFGMRPHHEQAVDMAEMILAKDPSPQIRTLAEQVRAEQQPEIELLSRMMDRFGADGDADADAGGHGGHGGGDMAMHGGMMSQEQMSSFEQATGADAERLFLEMMIEHHRGAMEAADAELRDGRDSEARELAESIRASQQAEIEEMQRLLQDL